MKPLTLNRRSALDTATLVPDDDGSVNRDQEDFLIRRSFTEQLTEMARKQPDGLVDSGDFPGTVTFQMPMFGNPLRLQFELPIAVESCNFAHPYLFDGTIGFHSPKAELMLGDHTAPTHYRVTYVVDPWV